MTIRLAKISDKKSVLSFCKNTFSWGDYISQVWNDWISHGYFLVLSHNKCPIAICHASIINNVKHVWIEGIRVKKNFRRKGFAKKLIIKSEDIARQKNCKISQMLIESKNTSSLKLATSLNYEKKEKWNFLTIVPVKTNSLHVEFATINNIPKYIFSKTNFYVQSWKWLPLNKKTISTLIKQKRIILSKFKKSINCFAIVTESDYFDKTIMLTIVFGTNYGIRKILKYIQNFAFENDFEKIQILTTKNLPSYIGLEKKLSFYLMTKKL